MAQFESNIKQIPYAQAVVYAQVSDLSNLEKVKDRLPEDQVKDMTFTADEVSVNSPVGEVSLRVIEREEPKCVKFETAKSPVPMNMWIQLVPMSEESCKMRVTIKADVPIFLKGMVSKPLQEAVEKIADVLAMVPYGEL